MSKSLRLTVLAGAILTLCTGPATAQDAAKKPTAYPAPERKPDIHFVPTPQPVVEEMLKTAKVGKDDVVYDLGCGDGRIVITAAATYGARGIGIDIDPQRIAESNANLEKAAAAKGRVEFKIADIFKANFSDASVITLYLLTSINERLRPKIFAETKPGTRVVSQSFQMGPWKPDEEKTVDGHRIYFWVVPANASGTWKASRKGGEGPAPTVTLTQTFQDLSGTYAAGDRTGNVTGKMVGNQLSLLVDLGGGKTLDVTGTVSGERIEATTSGEQGGKWTAERQSGTKSDIAAAAK